MVCEIIVKSLDDLWGPCPSLLAIRLITRVKGGSRVGPATYLECHSSLRVLLLWECHYFDEHPYHWIGIKVSVVAVSYSTGFLSTSTITEWTRQPTLVRLAARSKGPRDGGGWCLLLCAGVGSMPTVSLCKHLLLDNRVASSRAFLENKPLRMFTYVYIYIYICM